MSTAAAPTSSPGSIVETLDDRGSSVRFDALCVVIPDSPHHSRRPRVVTKSYALPLWKSRASSSSPSSPAPEDPPFEENHLVLRVPLPTFSLKPQSHARSIDHTPLPSCLVHRPPPSAQSIPRSPTLTRYTPCKTLTSRTDIVTVPLRPCCAACQPVTEAAFVDGDAWPEHFSRAASRRRSVSADYGPRTITVAGSTAAASYGALGVSISVDEVDKRRRSSDTGPSLASQERTWLNDAKATNERAVPLLVRRACASHATADHLVLPSPTRITPSTTPRIPEEEDDEDERELFPLPFPKRTPSASPAPSPAASLSSLVVAPAIRHPTPSTDLIDSSCKRHFLAPPADASSSSLSLPKTSESMTDLTSSSTEDAPPAPSPTLLSSLPSISGRMRRPSPCISCIPPNCPDTLLSATDGILPETPRSPSSITLPSPLLHPQPTPMHARTSWRPKRSVCEDEIPAPSSSTSSFSSSASPPSLSTSVSAKKALSMSLSSPRHIIAEVLRGVGAVGSGGLGGRM